MSSGMDMSDFLALFLEEAQEQLLKLDDGFLQLEKDPGNIEIIKEVFRAAHTLKGSSGTMGLMEITNLTHSMENLLDQVRSGNMAVTPNAIDLLLTGTDALRTLVDQVSRGEEMDLDTSDLRKDLHDICDNSSGGEAPAKASGKKANAAKSTDSAAPPASGISLQLRICESCLMPSVRAFMIYNALSGLGTVVSSDPPQDNLDDLQAGQPISIVFEPNSDAGESGVVDAMRSLSEIELVSFSSSGDTAASDTPTTAATQPNTATKSPATGGVKTEGGEAAKSIQTVRVGVDRLDTLMNLVAELVIDRTRMTQIANELSRKYENEDLCQSLNETGVHVGRVVTELQEHIMKVRLLPVEQVFNRFPRMVRDLAHKAVKDIDFVLEGQETELDRSILEEIVDPITHLLRNAVDHGIETPEQRKAAGKPARARVILAAKQEENRIIIEVQDDGHGIDIEKVKAAALKKGAVDEDTLSRMNDNDCLQLIFASGVSTAEKVTDVSGRGVGMDVVRSNIQGLSGGVEVHTELGKGTTFRINLPLTLAIIQSLVTGVGDRVYVVPLSAVVETFRCRESEMHYIDGNPAINFRGSVLHLIRLADLFPSHCEDSSDQDYTGATGWVTFVVVRTGSLKVGMVVDRLIGEHEVVIKSLGAFFGDIRGIAGATILGDGRVALIVDIGSIGGLINKRKMSRAA